MRGGEDVAEGRHPARAARFWREASAVQMNKSRKISKNQNNASEQQVGFILISWEKSRDVWKNSLHLCYDVVKFHFSR